MSLQNSLSLARKRLVWAASVAVLMIASQTGLRAEGRNAADELKDLTGRINVKLQAGVTSEEGLSNEVKEFDSLLAAHKDEKTEPVARILYMKGMLYMQVFNNAGKASEFLERVRRDYAGTAAASDADRLLVLSSLTEGKTFPDFNEKDVTGKPISAASYKGKVLLIDFWATWCMPCRAELPSVIKTYEKHHNEGFEIIGVSLDQDQAKLTTFISEQKMPWPQYFDGLAWGNRLADRYGIKSIPATFLLDGKGTILARNLRGEALEDAVVKALAAK